MKTQVTLPSLLVLSLSGGERASYWYQHIWEGKLLIPTYILYNQGWCLTKTPMKNIDTRTDMIRKNMEIKLKLEHVFDHGKTGGSGLVSFILHFLRMGRKRQLPLELSLLWDFSAQMKGQRQEGDESHCQSHKGSHQTPFAVGPPWMVWNKYIKWIKIWPWINN